MSESKNPSDANTDVVDDFALLGTGTVGAQTGDNRPSVYVEVIDGKPFYIFRASSLKQPDCIFLRALQGFEAAPPPPYMQAAFDQGNYLEPILTSRYELEHGCEVVNDQREVELPVGSNIIIRGHTDGEVWEDGEPHRIMEFKGLAPSSMDDVRKYGSVGKIFGYDLQLSFYMYATGLQGEWAAGLKGWEVDGEIVPWSKKKDYPNGELVVTDLHTERVETPPVPIGQLMKKVLGVVRKFEAGESSPCPDPYHNGCAYYRTHEKGDQTPEVSVAFGKRVTELVAEAGARLFEARAFSKEAKAMEDDAKKELVTLMAGTDKPLVTGGFKIVVTEQRGNKRLDRAEAEKALDVDLEPYFKRGNSFNKVTVSAVKAKGETE